VIGLPRGREKLLALIPLALLTGCGYPADPLPPALNRPTPVTDLRVVERGSKLVVTFTKPTRTTEDLPIKGGGDAELRIGVMPEGRLDLAQWERTSERVTGDVIDATKYYGKNVVVAVRVKGAKGQSAGWSNFVPLTVVQALPTPEGLEAKNAPDAVRLEWHAAAPSFRIFRKSPDQKEWTLLGNSTVTNYTDAAIEYGKTYEYYVQAAEKAGDAYAESEVSKTVTIAPEDTFAPAVPSGITVVPSARTMELLWDRNTEKDLKGYTVYRDGKKVAEGLNSPAYSDKDVKAGVRYSYQLTATDNKGNESAKSAAIEVLIP